MNPPLPRKNAPNTKARRWRELSVLIVGTGSIGRRHARVLRSLGVSDLRIAEPLAPQRAQAKAEGGFAAEYTDFAAGLADRPDAAFICTPPRLHVAQASLALQRGVHVFCEKPLAETLAQVRGLRQAIRRSGRVFAVGYCMRHHEALSRAKRHLDAGRIGRLVSVRCRMGEHLPDVRPDYRSLFTLREMGAFDLAHEIDLACWFAGQPVRRVKGMFGAYSDLGFTAPDLVELVIGFADRCLASVHLDFFGSPRMRATELIGTQGTIVVEYASWDEARLSLFDRAGRKWQTQRLKTERDHMFRAEDRMFLEAIANGTAVGCDFEAALQSLRVIEKARLAEGRAGRNAP